MTDFFKWIYELLRDKGTKWFIKLIFVLLFLLCLFLIDDYFGWSVLVKGSIWINYSIYFIIGLVYLFSTLKQLKEDNLYSK